MIAPVASIVIPAYNHAHCLPDAIASALAQSVPCEIVCVDDGSTDATSAILERFAGRVTTLRQPHAGVAAARNRGIEAATGEFVNFLDADDVLYPDAVAVRLEALEREPALGWAFGDIKVIDDISRQVEPASARYDYAGKGLPRRIHLAPLLAEANFVPVHAPLVRRSALGSIRFPDGKLEDWAFWRALAAVAPARYVDSVIGEYRKKRSGRNQGK